MEQGLGNGDVKSGCGLCLKSAGKNFEKEEDDGKTKEKKEEWRKIRRKRGNMRREEDGRKKRMKEIEEEDISLPGVVIREEEAHLWVFQNTISYYSKSLPHRYMR